MVIDNFDQILDILEFNNSDEFYFLQIIQRKKDGCVTDTGNNGYRTVKTYYIFSREQLERKRAKITELCQSNHARAYITLNRRNAEEVACTAIQEYAKLSKKATAIKDIAFGIHLVGILELEATSHYGLWMLIVRTRTILTQS